MANTAPKRLPWAKVAPGTPSANPDDFQWELYHVAEDFSQFKDLAAENPAKLKELQELFDREARKYNVYPLDASFAERADVSLRPSLTRGRDSFTYHPGTVRVPEGAAPDLKNKSFTVTAEVEIPEGGAEGVLVTHGGRFAGWGLLLIDGKPEYVHSFSNQPQHKYRVASKEKLAPGKHTIHFDFKYDGPGYGKSGTGILSRWTASRWRRARSSAPSRSASPSTKRSTSAWTMAHPSSRTTPTRCRSSSPASSRRSSSSQARAAFPSNHGQD
jgi:arylsulfatase